MSSYEGYLNCDCIHCGEWEENCTCKEDDGEASSKTDVILPATLKPGEKFTIVNTSDEPVVVRPQPTEVLKMYVDEGADNE